MAAPLRRRWRTAADRAAAVSSSLPRSRRPRQYSCDPTDGRLRAPPNGPDHGRRRAGRLLQDGQELPAGLLAPPAGLGTDAAVLVHVGMPLALVAAALAAGHAGLQQGPGDAGVVGRRAADDPDGSGA